ncbi:hypothetical protein F4779DRAFT_613467 [Xylariaceae sp. FL0662B]|nr:hypothetical protein F4779DRAFT_613467 [Xylariaceae sp. FL0662B]
MSSPAKDTPSPSQGTPSSGKKTPPPSKPRQLTPFELNVVLALICKGDHVGYQSKRKAANMAHRLNAVLNFKDVENQLSGTDVSDLLTSLQRERKGAFAFLNRQSAPHRLTRLKRQVFERGLDFDGSLKEWTVGRRKEREAKRKAELMFVGPRRALARGREVGVTTSTGGPRVDRYVPERAGNVRRFEPGEARDSPRSRSPIRDTDEDRERPHQHHPQQTVTPKNPVAGKEKPTHRGTPQNGNYNDPTKQRDSRPSARPYDDDYYLGTSPMSNYGYNQHHRRHHGESSSRPALPTPHEAPPTPMRYTRSIHPTGAGNHYYPTSSPTPGGFGATTPRNAAPTSPPRYYNNGHPDGRYHPSRPRQGYTPRWTPTSPDATGRAQGHGGHVGYGQPRSSVGGHGYYPRDSH